MTAAGCGGITEVGGAPQLPGRPSAAVGGGLWCRQVGQNEQTRGENAGTTTCYDLREQVSTTEV